MKAVLGQSESGRTPFHPYIIAWQVFIAQSHWLPLGLCFLLHYQYWALNGSLRYPAAALHCEDLAAFTLQDQLLHMSQQITDEMEAEVHQLIILDLSLGSCTVGQFSKSLPVLMTRMNSTALLWLVHPL